ncbi:hypothetical protein P4O66_001092 [Electrophorus voltai]|uniref:Reverse transcriptase/retrotransposon-derived protein RNase H-like domain-containing protein n=1 Tax=Electrophorus voltai TaxID=2609070 RepID=A0AAD8ZAJ5_9TELE|nr:hypothetical protein P4O66_001092 [Electrophorus voltai]
MPAADTALKDFKAAFTSALVLQQPNPTKPFVMEINSSDVGFDTVLSQGAGKTGKLWPITYFSHKLSPTERNYGVDNVKLLAMKIAIEEWRNWHETVQHLSYKS